VHVTGELQIDDGSVAGGASDVHHDKVATLEIDSLILKVRSAFGLQGIQNSRFCAGSSMSPPKNL
jgi:hypothetical protein